MNELNSGFQELFSDYGVNSNERCKKIEKTMENRLTFLYAITIMKM
ncbi:MAG: hypothetical protein IJN54_07480 [Lachnospiraceae bacterium]|nr:hypothetical protein [Lachnospiraceae bacterium]